jgi:hypothetical protein
MLGKMAEETLPNGFVENSISGSINPPLPKKKRNLPGTPGKLLQFLSNHIYCLCLFSIFFFFLSDE